MVNIKSWSIKRCPFFEHDCRYGIFVPCPFPAYPLAFAVLSLLGCLPLSPPIHMFIIILFTGYKKRRFSINTCRWGVPQNKSLRFDSIRFVASAASIFRPMLAHESSRTRMLVFSAVHIIYHLLFLKVFSIYTPC